MSACRSPFASSMPLGGVREDAGVIDSAPGQAVCDEEIPSSDSYMQFPPVSRAFHSVELLVRSRSSLWRARGRRQRRNSHLHPTCLRRFRLEDELDKGAALSIIEAAGSRASDLHSTRLDS